MPSNESTRLLCASALLSRQFRAKVLEHLEDKNRASSPEIGVDLSLIAQVCQFAVNRENRFLWFYFFIAIGGGVAALALTPVVGLAIFVLAAGGLYFKQSAEERSLVRRHFQRQTFEAAKVRADFNAALKPEIFSAIPRQDQNLVVYQGFTPFIGAGINLGGWSFVVDVDKATEDELRNPNRNKTVPFTPEEFYAAIDAKIYASRLDRITIGDYCFVNGADIRDDRAILPDIYGRPIQRLDDALLGMCRNASDPRVRHYQWIRIRDRDNELVMSYFLRCALRGNSLFVEINRFLLTPLFKAYRDADKMADFSFSDHLAAIGTSLVAGPTYSFFSTFFLLSRMQKGMLHFFGLEGHKRRREIESNPLYNYGAESSLRYRFSSDSFLHYFQKLDGEFYLKILEHQILDGVIEFLDGRNIDTSDIRERRTTILNNGVIVQGGDLKAESLAVGTGATAIKSQTAVAPKKSTEKGVNA